MISIIKWPKTILNKKRHLKKYLNGLSIKQKCIHCGTVINITSLNDIDYSCKKDNDEKIGHWYYWYFTCPYCEKTEYLSNKNLDFITRWIDINQVDLTHYEEMSNISYDPHIEKDRVDNYHKFHAHWIHFKYGVKVPCSLEDNFIYKEFINNPKIVEILTTQDGNFIDWLTFNKYDVKMKQGMIQEMLEDITKDKNCYTIREVEYAYEANGDKYHLILKTNRGCGICLTLNRSDFKVLDTEILYPNDLRLIKSK